MAGSYYVESLTDQIEKEAYDYIKKIDEMGGAVAAIEQGYMQQEMARNAFADQRDIETGKQTVIGVNKFVDNNEKAKEQDVLTVDLAVGERQIARLNKMKENRDNAAVKVALEKLRAAAKGTENLMPYLIDAVKTYATLGEICGVLREEFGEFKPSIYY